MADFEINPCPMCGSKAEVDSTDCLELYGKCWQELGVFCTGEFEDNCRMKLVVDCDQSYVKFYEEILVLAWNNIKRSIKCQTLKQQ